MKTTINSLKSRMLFLLFALFSIAIQAQENTTPLKTALDAKRFIFEAQTVLPNGGRSRQLTGERYAVELSNDSLRTYLPYFGRAYSASIGGDGGIKFTSTSFDYTIKEKRKGGWEISIKPKDDTDVRQLSFNISEAGYASLLVLSNNRQAISFTGKVNAVK